MISQANELLSASIATIERKDIYKTIANTFINRQLQTIEKELREIKS